MGQKRVFDLLDGATSTGAGTSVNIAGYQKAVYAEINTTAGTPDFTIQLQYKNELGSYVPYHEEVITASTDNPLVVVLKDFPWSDIRAEITAYTSGTISAWAYCI